MSEGNSSRSTSSVTVVPWSAMFIVLKVWGPLATWSWWWLLMPAVPDIWFILTKLGWI